ncbi:hypothetical protein Y032_0035g3116 [Ancylostoma ceylanicum]|uniref:Uncharacterized protein n=1 Tax=Ancylostoma ceylanicum TaxID=53326 RepID=A0A016ULM0_9BILA|nr:hypothetical protein Y032_0035g3116 [Ancylostoma ceylanicum]
MATAIVYRATERKVAIFALRGWIDAVPVSVLDLVVPHRFSRRSWPDEASRRRAVVVRLDRPVLVLLLPLLSPPPLIS